ncbi:MAG: SET domain-containing protein-lysine N-methyltransferase, partial [Mesorhizobium sp.]
MIFRSQLRWPRATQCAGFRSRATKIIQSRQGSAMLLVDVYLDKSPI